MKNTFYGWYMKCQFDSQTLAVIPAVHQNGKNIWIGENHFSQNGLQLNIRKTNLYRFCINGSPVFCFETDKASFEYEYPWDV